MTRLGLWYEKANPWLRSFASSVLVILPFYLTAVLAYFVRQGLDDKKLLGAYSGVTLLLLLILFLFRRYIEIRLDEDRRITERQRNSIGQAHNFSDELVAQGCEVLRAGLHVYQLRTDGTLLFQAAIASVHQINQIVERLYLVMEALYSDAHDFVHQINFEVTFMTKSYRDKEITVLSWRNRDRRAPRSLDLRNSNPTIYANTVTAELYLAARPEAVIISDAAGDSRYHEIYPGQKQRIRSSIVYPVLSDNNVLLGTLVVHCDSPGFFKSDDKIYWAVLLEIYAKRIAYQKLCLDIFKELDLGTWISTVDPKVVFDL